MYLDFFLGSQYWIKYCRLQNLLSSTDKGETFDEETYLNHKHRMKPVATRLGELLGQSVKLAPDCIANSNATVALQTLISQIKSQTF